MCAGLVAEKTAAIATPPMVAATGPLNKKRVRIVPVAQMPPALGETRLFIIREISE